MQFLVARHVNVLSAQHGGFLIGLVTDKETPFGLGGQSKLVIYGLITPLLTIVAHGWASLTPVKEFSGSRLDQPDASGGI